jgi:hypothetical protein
VTIYTIKHPTPGFRGIVFGVDFFDGKGSTSDLGQVCDLLDLGKGYKVGAPLSEDDKADLQRFRKQRQPFKDLQRAKARELPKTNGWILP